MRDGWAKCEFFKFKLIHLSPVGGPTDVNELFSVSRYITAMGRHGIMAPGDFRTYLPMCRLHIPMGNEVYYLGN